MSAKEVPVMADSTRRVAARRKGRSRTGADFLDKPTLVRGAAEVADRVGWSEFTLSQVAREVHRHVTSMYAHVNGLDDLRREITLLAFDELGDAVWAAAIGHVKEEALAAIARVIRDYCEAYPARAAAIALSRHGGDAEIAQRAERLAEPTRATLRSFGLSEQQVPYAHRIFSITILGFTQGERGELIGTERADETFRQLMELFFLALRSGAWPAVTLSTEDGEVVGAATN